MKMARKARHFHIRLSTFLFMAAGLGFEPRYSAPKADVLPLDDPAMRDSSPTKGGQALLTGGQACLPTDRQVLRMIKKQLE